MALATTCPQCKTSFKVVPDQLKLRRGMVRCGMCQHVFSGIDFLRYVDESAKGGSSTRAPSSAVDSSPAVPPAAVPAPRAALDMAPPQAGDDTHGCMDAVPPGTPASDGIDAHGEPALTPALDPMRYPEVAPDANPPDAGIAPWPTLDPREPDDHDRSEPQEERDAASRDADLPSPEDDLDRALDALGLPEPTDTARQAALPRSDDLPGGSDDTAAIAGAHADDEVGLGALGLTPADGDEWHSLDPTGDDSLADRRQGRDRIDIGLAGDAHDGIDDARANADRDPSAEAMPAVDTGDRDDWGIGGTDAGHVEQVPGSETDPKDPNAIAPPAASEGRAPLPLGDGEAEDAIDYFSTSDHSRRGFSSRLAPVGWVVCGLLVLLLLAQLALGGRSVMAGAFPGAQAWLAERLAAMNLKIAAPRDLASLTIESFELQTSPTPGVLTMSALLRNRADYPVQWPALELSLTDGTGALLVRKVILPADYLAGGEPGGTSPDGAPPDPDKPIGPRAERPLKMDFEARDLVPAGFSVNLFYP